MQPRSTTSTTSSRDTTPSRDLPRSGPAEIYHVHYIQPRYYIQPRSTTWWSSRDLPRPLHPAQVDVVYYIQPRSTTQWSSRDLPRPLHSAARRADQGHSPYALHALGSVQRLLPTRSVIRVVAKPSQLFDRTRLVSSRLSSSLSVAESA